MRVNELITQLSLTRLPTPIFSRQLSFPKVKHSAVLVPIVCANSPYIILTLRPEYLKHHPHQVCFPGGKLDPSDINLRQTALRETQEEIGIQPDKIKIVSQLSSYTTLSQFSIKPYVGLIEVPCNLSLNQAEVKQLIELPLTQLMDMKIDCIEIEQHNSVHSIYHFSYQGLLIWGATAAILKQLQQQLLVNDLTNG